MGVTARAELFLDETAADPVCVLLDRPCVSTRDAGRAVMAVAGDRAAHLAFAYTGDAKRGCALVRHPGGALESGENVLWRAGEWRIDVFLTRTRAPGPGVERGEAGRVAWRLAETVAVIRATIAGTQ